MSSRVTDWSVSSSSTTICVPSAVDVGQQLRDTGRNASSEDLSCHFKSGAGALARYARDGSRTSKMLLACEALFRFGCTLYLKSWFWGASLKHTRPALAASRTVTWNWPVHTASPSKPPSTCISAVIFSSMSTFTGSSRGFTTGAGAGSSMVATAPAASGAGSGAPKMSPGFFLPSVMPFVAAFGLNGAGPSSAPRDEAQGDGEFCIMSEPPRSIPLIPPPPMPPMPPPPMPLMPPPMESLPMPPPPPPCASAEPKPAKPPAGPGVGSLGAMARCFASSICFFLAVSRASLILLCSIIWCSFSS
mmetsp:Transcript_22229/g.56623  ORF Transcript_22229/g.56623 Transcript_22229/m.56623 type:complete len:304 (+) Transcript_22229:775-1686(+)